VFRAKANSKRFVLGRSSEQTNLAAVKRRYRRNIELALVISLAAAIVTIRLLSMVHFDQFFVFEDRAEFESIDIIEIPPAIEEPPKLKMEEVVEIPPEEESEKSAIEKEIEQLIEEEKDEVQLSLSSNNLGELLLSNSPLGDIAGPELNFRKVRADDASRIDLKSRKFYGDANSGLDIGKTESSTRKISNDNVGLDLKTKPVEFGKTAETNKKSDPKLGISDVPERIISFASSTFGTEDYKLWNKINSELDRLNKGRYGSVPKEIERFRGGFLIHFSFPDGTRQEIHWENAGNVWIKIIGKSNRTQVQELRRALDSLLKLTLGS
jgi:hypothetical protein